MGSPSPLPNPRTLHERVSMEFGSTPMSKSLVAGTRRDVLCHPPYPKEYLSIWIGFISLLAASKSMTSFTVTFRRSLKARINVVNVSDLIVSIGYVL